LGANIPAGGFVVKCKFGFIGSGFIALIPLWLNPWVGMQGD
jgi:hypothetical protein